jgi:hypothetical protein
MNDTGKLRKKGGLRVSRQAEGMLILVALILAMVAVAILLSRFLFRRAVRKVVSVFRQVGATSPTTAATVEELGLVPPGIFERVGRLRDYRPEALRLLVQAGVVKETQQGRLYLSEDALEQSSLKGFTQSE